MPKLNNKTAISSSLISGGIGTASSIVIALLLTVIGAIFIENEYLNIGSVNILALTIQFVSSLVGTLIAGKLSRTNYFLSCGAVCGCYFLLMLITAMLFFDGVGGSVLLSALAILIGGGTAILLCTKGNNRIKRRKKRVRSR